MTFLTTNSFLVTACGLDAEQHSWPFGEGPDMTDVRSGISSQYRDWRAARGLPLEKSSTKKAATTPKPAPEKQDNSFKNVDDLPSQYR